MRMLGRQFFFFTGMYMGMLTSQRYYVPKLPSPKEVWNMIVRMSEREKSEQNLAKDYFQPRLSEQPETKVIIAKLKSLEKKYRKPTAPSSDNT